MGTLIYEEETYAIRGAVFEVYREMGCGFLEAVYQECMEKELSLRQVPFESQREIRLSYKGSPLLQTYKPDLICYGKIIVELKALKELDDAHRAQLLNYLKATSMKVGLLINYGFFPEVQIERFAL